METQANDTEFLEHLLAGNCQLPTGVEPLKFCLALLENFHSTDARLRDRLSYSILMNLLTKQHVLNIVERQILLQTALDERHLFYGIGETESDSVFMRGFSILVVPLVLDPDIQNPQLDSDLVHETIQGVVSYAREERDRRGYVDGKGWAHTIAHTADALDSCAQHPFSTDMERMDVLNCIAELAMVSEPICFQEDDRLAFTASRILGKGCIANSSLDFWFNRFAKPEGPEAESVIRLANQEHFLRSLYFLLKWKHVDGGLIDRVDERLCLLSWYVQANVL